MYDQTRKALPDIIRKGRADGSLRNDANPLALIVLISSLTDGNILNLDRGNANVLNETITRASRDMIIRNFESASLKSLDQHQ